MAPSIGRAAADCERSGRCCFGGSSRERLYTTRMRPVTSLARTARRAPAPLALMAVIFVLSAQPDLDSGLGVWDTILRKLAHALAFGGLGALWWWALRPMIRNPTAVAGAIALAYAIADEFHQSFVEGRSGTATDVAIDAV